jgi:hypothetical protein
VSAPDDPRFEWIEIPTMGGPSEWIRGACRHHEPVEVRSVVDGELLAYLCPDCDTQLPANQRDSVMSERVTVRVVLLFGDQAEVVADVPPDEQGESERYPAAEIAEAVGLEPGQLPGRRLTAEVGVDYRLSGWQLA